MRFLLLILTNEHKEDYSTCTEQRDSCDALTWFATMKTIRHTSFAQVHMENGNQPIYVHNSISDPNRNSNTSDHGDNWESVQVKNIMSTWLCKHYVHETSFSEFRKWFPFKPLPSCIAPPPRSLPHAMVVASLKVRRHPRILRLSLETQSILFADSPAQWIVRRQIWPLTLHLTAEVLLTEREGFEPSVVVSTTPVFKTGAFNHSATSPWDFSSNLLFLYYHTYVACVSCSSWTYSYIILFCRNS